jgi:hypothetical protein
LETTLIRKEIPSKFLSYPTFQNFFQLESLVIGNGSNLISERHLSFRDSKILRIDSEAFYKVNIRQVSFYDFGVQLGEKAFAESQLLTIANLTGCTHFNGSVFENSGIEYLILNPYMKKQNVNITVFHDLPKLRKVSIAQYNSTYPFLLNSSTSHFDFIGSVYFDENIITQDFCFLNVTVLYMRTEVAYPGSFYRTRPLPSGFSVFVSNIAASILICVIIFGFIIALIRRRRRWKLMEEGIDESSFILDSDLSDW